MTPEQFLTSLRARGVEVSVKNNRLRLDPGVTWRKLTVDEAECVSAHRAAIKLLLDGTMPAVPTEPTTEPATPKPPRVYSVEVERFVTEQDLSDAGVVGTDRTAFQRARNWLREQAREERSFRATATMLESLRRQRLGYRGGFR